MDALESYVALCREQSCLSPEGRAFCTLAECQQALGDMTSAMLSLETFLEMTQQNDAEVSLPQDQGPEISCLQVVGQGLLGFLREEWAASNACLMFDRCFDGAFWRPREHVYGQWCV